MDRFFIALVIAALCTLTGSLAHADEAAAPTDPVADPLQLMLAQIKSWGGGSGPRQRDCQRVCENTQVNCQRGCFGLTTSDAQNGCSLQCLSTYLGCADGCRPGSTSGAAGQVRDDDDGGGDSSG